VNAFASIIYLLVCGMGSAMLTRWAMSRSGPGNGVLRFETWTVFFFTSFFGGFYILGYINLATDFPVVDSLFASVIALVVFTGFGLRLVKKMPGLLRQGENSGRSHNAVMQLSLPGNTLTRTLAMASIVIFALIALMLIAGFPRGYEPQSYHLPVAVHIFQVHSLKVWSVWTTDFTHAFPANASIYFGFLLGLVSEHLVAAAGLVFLIPLGVGAYGIGRATGADETASLLSSLGLVTIPILVAPAFEAGSDVGGAAFLAIAIYFAVARPSGRQWDLVLSGLAAGLAFGFKSLHLIGIAFLFLVILRQAWSQSLQGTALERLWGTVRAPSLFLASTFATSGFWLVRNYVQLGNPLYPVYVPMFGILGWTKAMDFAAITSQNWQFAWVNSSAEWFVYPWLERLRASEDVFHKHGLGPFFAATVPVACLTVLIGALKRETKKSPVTIALFGGGLFVLAFWWLLNDRQPRYLMGALVFLVPLVAWTMDQATGFSRRVFEYIAALCISSALLMTFSLELVEFGTRFIYGRQFTRWAFYQYPAMIDRLPPESTVVNLGHRTRNYSLFGETHQNRVVVHAEALSALQASLEGRGADEAPQIVPLSHLVLHRIGATHLVTEGYPKLIPDECVELQKIAGLDKDIFGNPLSDPISLYRIKFCN
jgi:hypothetical protein